MGIQSYTKINDSDVAIPTNPRLAPAADPEPRCNFATPTAVQRGHTASTQAVGPGLSSSCSGDHRSQLVLGPNKQYWAGRPKLAKLHS